MKKNYLMLFSILILSLTIITGCEDKSINYKPIIENEINSGTNYIPPDDTLEEVTMPVVDTTDEPVNNLVDHKELAKEDIGDGIEPFLLDQVSVEGLSNDRNSWWFKRNAEHTPPLAQQDIDLSLYSAYYLGDTKEKVIYLTFDEGYENGYTGKILDILKENDVEAAFFVTKPYIESCPDLVKRMVDEGHIVGNHSDTHPDMTTKTDDEILKELSECADYFEEVTGTKMPGYFRPPEGVYSERTLAIVNNANYKTIFWSFAYKDWDRNDQPGKDVAYNMMMDNYHNGSIILLHAVSESNTEALDDMIKSLKDLGYKFASLNELP